MLVITRKVNEDILIGDILVRIIRIIRRGAGSVQVGIDAPADVQIYRAELGEWKHRDVKKRDRDDQEGQGLD